MRHRGEGGGNTLSGQSAAQDCRPKKHAVKAVLAIDAQTAIEFTHRVQTRQHLARFIEYARLRVDCNAAHVLACHWKHLQGVERFVLNF